MTTPESICASCGQPFAGNGRGRPRRYCQSCRPSGDPAAVNRAWRAENRDAYNAAARRRYHANRDAERARANAAYRRRKETPR